MTNFPFDIKIKGTGRVITLREQCEAANTEKRNGCVYRLFCLPEKAQERLSALSAERGWTNANDPFGLLYCITEDQWMEFLNTL